MCGFFFLFCRIMAVTKPCHLTYDIIGIDAFICFPNKYIIYQDVKDQSVSRKIDLPTDGGNNKI